MTVPGPLLSSAPVMGIDPGVSGAIAELYPDGRLYTYEMPVFTLVTAGRTRRHVNAVTLSQLLTDPFPAHVFVEQVGARPGERAGAAFAFGEGFGVIKGVTATLSLPVSFVRPQVWKKALGITANKGQARQRATELFPGNAEDFARVKDDGKAEAALIAWYGVQQMKGERA
ncbi:MAG: hypothetical protein ACE5FN_12435 [Leptospirillia bacterium]